MAEVFIDYKGERLEVGDPLLEKRPFSPSAAKRFRKSPKHYVQAMIEPPVQTKAMLLGSLVDVLALTPHEFESKFMIYRPAEGKGSKAINDKQKEDARDQKRMLITEDDKKIADKAVAALYDHEMARALLENRSKTQDFINWNDRENNIPCVGKIDFETNIWQEQFVVDLKTANDGEPDKFNRDAYNNDYYIQCGAYLDGYHKAKYQFPYFIFLVVETQEPFNVVVNFIDNKTAQYCRDEWAGTLKALRYCIDNKQFDKGYDFRLFDGMDYFSMKVPGYAKPKFGNFAT